MDASYGHHQPQRYTLSDFSRYVAGALSNSPVLRGAWVTAEISDLSMSGGHCYMTLIEKDSRGTTIARMRATIWAGAFVKIRRDFLKATERELANGMKVMFYGGVNYHHSYGLSFNIGSIDPSYTMGDLERIRQEILEALRREGIIDRNKRLPITDPPQRIAVISSGTAAGYGDFINQLEHNAAGAVFYPMLFPATMQGERTASTVIEALDLVENTINIAGWDCVVIIRGGGSTTDMNGFDNLELARRIATFPIPIAVGIGHERDRCVLDEIACIRCKTPTAVAAWLSDTAAIAWQKASDLMARIASFSAERLKGERIRLQSIETMLPAIADRQIKNAHLRLQAISGRLPSLAGDATSKERIRLERLSAMLKFSAEKKIEKEIPLLETLKEKLRTSATQRIDHEKMCLENISRLIDVLNPETTLKRGYTITRLNGHAITSASTIKPGDRLVTTTAAGTIISTANKPE